MIIGLVLKLSTKQHGWKDFRMRQPLYNRHYFLPKLAQESARYFIDIPRFVAILLLPIKVPNLN